MVMVSFEKLLSEYTQSALYGFILKCVIDSFHALVFINDQTQLWGLVG